MTAPRIALLADDLTSAGDGAAPFRAAGLSARIMLDGSALPGEGLTAGVTAVDLDTRSGAASAAGTLTAVAAAALAGADVLFKTVDSTVRGHLAVEIESALSSSGRATAVIAPAFPAEGRTTAGGVQLLSGTPVDRTAFARDPAHPVRTADLTALIPGAVRAGDNPAARVGTARYVVADASCDRDLDAVVAAVPRPADVLWVGSPGLAAALARRLCEPCATAGPAADMPSAAPTPAMDRSGPGQIPARTPGRGAAAARVLIVVGSLHPAGRAQMVRLASHRAGVKVPVHGDRPVEEALRQLAAGGTAVLYGPDEPAATGSVPRALAGAVARLAERRGFDALILTGGETARAVLRAIGTGSIELAGHPEPGVALGVLDSPRQVPVALKAGGFGDPDTLVRLTGLLRAGPGRYPR